MKFIKKWVINFIVAVTIFAGLYIAFPDLMGQVFEIIIQLIGPWLLIIILLVGSIPKKPVTVKIVDN